MYASLIHLYLICLKIYISRHRHLRFGLNSLQDLWIFIVLSQKNNFDLTETAILPITEQYLSYISELDEAYFELAGDYLLMASTLVAIKSELLLPQSKVDDDEISPKARLIRRLEEYAQIKEAARRIDGLLRLERDVF